MAKDYFLLALSNLKHRGIRSWLTMLGIFIGIAAVVSLISMGQGLQEAITGQFATLSADRLTIQNAGNGFGPPGSTSVKKLNDHDLKIIESIPEITNVIPRLIRVVSLEYNNVRNFHYIASIPDDQKKTEYVYDSFGFKIESGRLLKADDRGKIVLGNDFLTDQSYDKKINLGSKILVQGRSFEVVGFLKKASTFQLNSVVFMTEDEVKEIMNIGDEIDIIAVQVVDKNKIDEASKEIERKLRQDRHEKIGEEDFSVETPLKALSSINTILTIINIIVTGIAAISLLVGGIGITNAMFTSVLERTKEIGTMKAVGAKNSDIMKVFIIESSLLGLVGGIVGAIIGLGFAFGASYAANTALNAQLIDVRISYPLIFAAILFSCIIGLISGIIPAIQASRMKPTEALRQ